MADIEVSSDDVRPLGEFLDDLPIGVAIDENNLLVSGHFSMDGELLDAGIIYHSDEPRRILEALPGWLRRVIVAYARSRMDRGE